MTLLGIGGGLVAVPAQAQTQPQTQAQAQIQALMQMQAQTQAQGAVGCSAPWSPATFRAITEWGARLAPPDLARQIVRRAAQYRRGVDLAVAEIEALRGAGLSGPSSPSGLSGQSGVSGSAGLSGPAGAQGRPARPAAIADLARRSSEEATRAAALVRAHRSFDEVVEHLGRAAAWTAAAGQPLTAVPADPEASLYCGDFALYAESVRPRIARVVYRRQGPLDAVLRAATARARDFAAAVGREYRRVGGPAGVRGVDRFDDRSTAFAVSALSFNHSTSDVAATLRWAWLDAGGGDRRIQLTQDANGKLLILGLPGLPRPEEQQEPNAAPPRPAPRANSGQD